MDFTVKLIQKYSFLRREIIVKHLKKCCLHNKLKFLSQNEIKKIIENRFLAKLIDYYPRELQVIFKDITLEDLLKFCSEPGKNILYDSLCKDPNFIQYKIVIETGLTSCLPEYNDKNRLNKLIKIVKIIVNSSLKELFIKNDEMMRDEEFLKYVIKKYNLNFYNASRNSIFVYLLNDELINKFIGLRTAADKIKHLDNSLTDLFKMNGFFEFLKKNKGFKRTFVEILINNNKNWDDHFKHFLLELKKRKFF